MRKTIMVALIAGLSAVCSAQEKVETETESRSEQAGSTASQTSSQESDDNESDPNSVPYITSRSVFAHFFALPAKVWRLVWTPLGAFTIWVERNRIQEKAIDFFLNDDRTAGFFPMISIGGRTGAGGGLAAFHSNLFNQQKKISFNFLYSSKDSHSANLAYSDSSLFGTAVYFDLTAEYFSDSDENYFEGGNVQEAETSYSLEEAGVEANLGYAFNRRVGVGWTAGYKYVDAGEGSGKGGDRFLASGVLGIGANRLFSIGGTLTLNFRNGWPRSLSGTFARFAFQHNRDVDDSQFKFNRYSAELHQFLAVPFLARNRRLAIRGLFEKVNRLAGKQVPFYELSVLGDAANLRGFAQDRFRARGLLLFSIEYRYPVWDTWDAVIFVDEGQVFDRFDEIDMGKFHFAIGTGFRFMSQTGFVMRFEIAASRESTRALFQFTPNF